MIEEMLFCESPNAYSSLAMYSHAALTASFTATRVMSSVACAVSPPRPHVPARASAAATKAWRSSSTSSCPPHPHTPHSHTGWGTAGTRMSNAVGKRGAKEG